MLRKGLKLLGFCEDVIFELQRNCNVSKFEDPLHRTDAFFLAFFGQVSVDG